MRTHTKPRQPRPSPPVLVVGAVSTLLVWMLGACGTSNGPAANSSRHESARAPSASASATSPSTRVPRWIHIVVVIEENHSYTGILGGESAPYLSSLAAGGASFTDSFAVTHPSQPNYLALFSGSTQRLADDSCPHSFGSDNLGHQLLVAGYGFVGYSEGLPAPGSRACASGTYARKHAPWVDFTDLPSSVDQPFRAFPTDFAKLPSVSFVIPDLDDDMHDGTVAQADNWLRAHLGSYARWAPRHHSLLIVTWDEDDDTARNQIPTLAVGADVRAGPQNQHITHYSLLRTLEDSFGLRPIAAAARAHAITALTG